MIKPYSIDKYGFSRVKICPKCGSVLTYTENDVENDLKGFYCPDCNNFLCSKWSDETPIDRILRKMDK